MLAFSTPLFLRHRSVQRLALSMVRPSRRSTRLATRQLPGRGVRSTVPTATLQSEEAERDGPPQNATARPTKRRRRAVKNKRPETQETTLSEELEVDSVPGSIGKSEDYEKSSKDNGKGKAEKAVKKTVKKTRAVSKAPPPLIYPPEHSDIGYERGNEVMRIVSWNVASLRSTVKNGHLSAYLSSEKPDILCVQETKLHEAVMKEVGEFDQYKVHWNHSEKKGYSGVAIFEREDLEERLQLKIESVKKGCGEETADSEGRVLTAYFNTGMALVNCYVPNAGNKLKRLEYRTEGFEGNMRDFVNGLEESGHNVIYTGDLNCAHEEIDIHNSKANQKSAGHTPEERKEFGKLLCSGKGWVDSWRELYKEYSGFTYYSRRFGEKMKNEGKGWRLDYFVIDSATWKSGLIKDVFVRPDVMGSDHYPVVLDWRLGKGKHGGIPDDAKE